MSIDVLSSIYSLAVSVVTSAQPVWDGGVVNFFLNNVLFLNASEKQSPSKHFFGTVNSGGYLAGLVCGIIWAAILLLCGLWLLVMHCRRKSDSKIVLTYSMLANRIQYRNSANRHRWQCIAVQSIMSDFFVIIAIVFCVLGFVVNAHLNNAMTSKQNENALLPRISAAVNNVKDYMEMLVPHARIATKPIVDEIVHNTEVMQNKSKAIFTVALTKRMKGDILAKQGKMLIDYFDVLFENMKTIQISQELIANQKLNKNINSTRVQIDKICGNLKDRGEIMPKICLKIKSELGVDNIVNINFGKVRLTEAGTFVGLLTEYGRTPDAMKEKLKETMKKKHAMERKLYLKSKRLLKVEETIRNMTRDQWDNLETKVQGASGMLENASVLINGDVHGKLSKYETFRNLVYLFVLLLMIVVSLVCATVFIHHFCFPGDLTRRVRNTTKVLLYVLMMCMSFVVIVCMATFLIGGYFQTEVCRYLEEKPLGETSNSTLHLDKLVNKWLDENWAKIESLAGNESSMPMPRPSNIFRGLYTSCKANQSIMIAINGIESMNLSTVSKPGMTARFLRLGRQLMHEGFQEAKPDDFLRPTMKKDMNDLLDMAKKFIVKSNYSDYVTELKKPLLTRDVSGVSSQMDLLLTELRKTIDDKSVVIYAELFSVKKQWAGILSDINDLQRAVQQQITAFIQVKNHMNLSDVVHPMFPAIDMLSKFVYNKTHWISVADELYDEIIVKLTHKNSPKLMAQSTRKIMSTLGPCRHLYNAYSDVVFASCAAVVQPLNLMWFFLGVAVLFLTPTVVIALLLLAKSMGMDKAEFSEKNGAREQGDLEMHGKGDEEDMETYRMKEKVEPV